MHYFRYLIWFAVIVVGVIFTLLNSRTVEIDYYFGTAKANIFLPLLILIAMIVGALLAYISVLPKLIRQGHRIRKLHREIEEHAKYPGQGL